MSTRSDVRPRAARRTAAAPSFVSPLAEACDVFHIDPAKVARLRQALISPTSVDALAETFRALGDPTRVRVLDALSHGELCVCDLASLLGLSQSATSHQLRLLRTLRLVRTRRAGRMVFYALDDRHIVTLFNQGLRHVEESAARPGRRLA
jgi:ArsR family transcriptional regulator, lead/cadmium/zinc/bismuth-responsive transcriptional repressor